MNLLPLHSAIPVQPPVRPLIYYYLERCIKLLKTVSSLMFAVRCAHIVKQGLVVAVGIIASIQAAAQEKDFLPPVSSTYAIRNVTITQAPGRTINDGSVVIRNGVIHEVGRNVTIPTDAIVIDGDSMYLYAGFIDGYSHTGVIKPEHESGEKVKDPGQPPPARAGITPEKDVRDLLDPEERTLAELRAAGFTCSQVVPFGVFLPGNGAVIVLGGTRGDEMVLKSSSCLYSKLVPRQGVFPSTIIGVMAKWRELYQQAILAKTYEQMYAANSAGLPRHCPNRVLQAFYPVIDRQMPVLFKGERVLDIQRALTLQKDLGLSPITVANVKEGWDVIDKLKEANANVFLSLDLPDEDKCKEGNADSVANEEMKALIKRRQEFMNLYVSQAAAFQRAGVPFGFSSMGMKAKYIHKNLRRMVAGGLSEDYALAALTTHPARILGLSDKLGTVDKGKIANLVITDKPYFDEHACIKYVFVDGELMMCKKKETKEVVRKVVNIEGKWSLVTETPQGKVDLKVIFKKEDDRYKGSISGGNLPEDTRLSHVFFENDKLKYVYSVKVGENMVDVTIEGTVDEKSFKGNMIVGQFGSFPIEGTKDPNL